MPDWRPYVRDRLPPLAVAPQREAEIVAELALQLEQAYQDALSAGASEPKAQRRAEAQFARWDVLAREIDAAERQIVRPVDREPRAGNLSGGVQDLRYAARFFARNPAFAAVAVVTLAFGIGGNTAVHHGGCPCAAQSSLSRSGPADGPRYAQNAATRIGTVVLRAGLLRYPRAHAHLLRSRWNQPRLERHSDWARRSRAARELVRLGRSFSDARRECVAGAHVPAAGRQPNAAFPCGAAVPFFLAAPVRRQSSHPR